MDRVKKIDFRCNFSVALIGNSTKLFASALYIVHLFLPNIFDLIVGETTCKRNDSPPCRIRNIFISTSQRPAILYVANCKNFSLVARK